MNEVYDAEAARREEAVYRTQAAAERRRRVREALDLDGGETVLSLGPGPGFEPAELAAAVDVRSVIGVERSEAMLALAAERCASDDAVSLIAGEATALPLPDGTVDAALSVQVYGYVDALDDALVELARVLRPGGRAVVYATDWETLVWRVGDPDLAERVYDAWDGHCARPRLGSALAAPLRNAGLRVEYVEPYAICNASLENTFAGRLVPAVREHTADVLDRATADAWTGAVRDRERAGETFFCLTGSLYRVTKPR
ncbi:methyltransferase domain-containing protein [Halomarina pelagica]|uniref:methyltransferase domain-containing protein n=1 Tax=Halomarina pelagica TaxID=2961599 RepID=UPI0020C2E4E3|nr:methyltransferase domain-containing protein [Halomarina sp. BND7]